MCSERLTPNSGCFHSVQVVDARSGGRFEGTDPEPRPGLPSGHMIGALNVPFKDLINEDTKLFKDKEQLQEGISE